MTKRRQFLKLATLTGLSTMVSACTEVDRLKWVFGQPTPVLPDDAELYNGMDTTTIHILKRLTYSPCNPEIMRIKEIGSAGFIREQLSPHTINDQQADWLIRRIETIKLSAPDIFEIPAKVAITDLRRAMLLRALYSKRQLLEIMVEFWSDHFNIFAAKGDCAWLKVIDDREVIRPHALGKFRDLLRASATSTAMLVYLDGSANVQENPNENYARELLELHTLGINGGYQQRDVMELARALTGWQLKNRFWRGQSHFVRAAHDQGTKIVLAEQINNQNESELEQIIDLVSNHPATAQFLSKKLCQRFVSDQPSTQLVNDIAKSFTASQGDIPTTLSTIFQHDEFLHAPEKFKRPYTYAISALRSLAAVSNGGEALQQHLRAMGQLPFDWPTPDGYPQGEEHWSAQLLARWQFALALMAGKIAGTSVKATDLTQLPPLVLARTLTNEETSLFNRIPDHNIAIALLLAAPDFQYH